MQSADQYCWSTSKRLQAQYYLEYLYTAPGTCQVGVDLRTSKATFNYIAFPKITWVVRSYSSNRTGDTTLCSISLRGGRQRRIGTLRHLRKS